MAYIAGDPNKYIGKSSGNGQCVAFVREAANAPHTSAYLRLATRRFGQR